GFQTFSDCPSCEQTSKAGFEGALRIGEFVGELCPVKVLRAADWSRNGAPQQRKLPKSFSWDAMIDCVVASSGSIDQLSSSKVPPRMMPSDRGNIYPAFPLKAYCTSGCGSRTASWPRAGLSSWSPNKAREPSPVQLKTSCSGR